MIKVCKRGWKAVQWTGYNSEELTTLSEVTTHGENKIDGKFIPCLVLFFGDKKVKLYLTDWLVYSPKTGEYKAYRDEDFNNKFIICTDD